MRNRIDGILEALETGRLNRRQAAPRRSLVSSRPCGAPVDPLAHVHRAPSRLRVSITSRSA